jgi:hypothetical protein
MRIGRIILAGLALLLLSACSYWRDMNARDDFEKYSKGYNKMVRWQETEQACLLYVDKAIRDRFLARVEAAREVKIADYRIKSLECDPERKEATARVEMDYYIPPSTRLKTLEDVQKWTYVEDDAVTGWRLISLFPEFK